MMAGKAYLSITSSTKTNFGAFQILRWTFKEIAMCPILSVKCSNSNQATSFLPLFIKNIGEEKIFIKLKYNSPLHNANQ